jgi:hypothetical protein
MTANVYCIDDFKEEFDKLLRKKSYQHLENLIIEYFFKKSIGNLKSGTRLNQSKDAPYIKKRIPDSGGFRFYFLLLMKKDSVYLMFVHPKTGSLGVDNLTSESIRFLYKRVYCCIRDNTLYKMDIDNSTNKLTFRRVKPKKTGSN